MSDEIKRLRSKLGPAIAKEMRLQMIELSSYIREERMTGGTTPTKLATRSGRLKKSVRPAPTVAGRGKVETGILVGTVYGKMHFGKKGSKTTIVPKKKKFLTIPLDAAKTPSGDARGSARSGVWGDTFVKKSPRGALIIYGKRVTQKGPNAGKTRGQIVPLFLLLKKVEVPARIDPYELAELWRPRIIRALGRLAVKVVGEVQ